MPISRKRKGQTTRRPAKKSRTSRRAPIKGMHAFSKWIDNPVSFTGGAGNLPLRHTFVTRLDQVSDVTALCQLFDQYRITYVQARFFLKIDPAAQIGSAASYPRLFYTRDYTDGDLVLSLNDIRSHEKSRSVVLVPNKPVVVGWKPAVCYEIGRVGVSATPQYAPKWGQWLQLENNVNFWNVPHYGLKWAIDDLTNTNYRVDTEIRVWMQFRGGK